MEIVFERTDLNDPVQRMKLAEALFDLHLQRRLLKESTYVNKEILNNTVYK